MSSVPEERERDRKIKMTEDFGAQPYDIGEEPNLEDPIARMERQGFQYPKR